jgi:uncharacterized protein DUF3857/transglutaminase superfamily protein
MRRNSLHLSVLAGALALAPVCGHASVPDWVRRAAQSPASKVPDDTKAVMLLNQKTTTVQESGEIRATIRRAYRILRPEGHDYGLAQVAFGADSRLTYIKGWTLSADGNEYEVKEKDCVETSLFNETLYEDTRRKVCQLAAALPGSVVAYEYELQQRPDIRQDDWEFQKEVPVFRARFELSLPQGWEYDVFWLNHAPVEPHAGEKGVVVWELSDLPGIEKETDMPAREALTGRLAVTFFGRGGGQGKASPAAWAGVARWYSHLAEGRARATPEIKQEVAELTTGKPDSLAKIQALAGFVQHEVRYVAIEVGVGGYQPHAAAEIFTNRYGDCKDKATLLSAMLAEIGVGSQYVLVNAERHVVDSRFPSMLNFNHVILAIRIPGDSPHPTLFALEQDPIQGNTLYFDPTEPDVPLGYLPWELQGSWGLLVGQEGGKLVQLPLLPPAVNRLLRTARLSMDAEGNVLATVQEIRWGAPAFAVRSILVSIPEAQRSQYVEEFIGKSVGQSSLIGSKVENLDQLDKTLILDYRFLAKGYVKFAGNILLLRPRLLGQKSSDVLEEKERKYPVEFPNTSLDTDVFEFVLPLGYEVEELPDPVSIQSPFGEYHSEIKMEGNVLKYQRYFTIKTTEVALDHLGELKKFFRDVEADERSTVILKAAAP